MAIDDAYATVVQYNARYSKTISTQDVSILDDLKAISRYIDGQVGRFFTKDASAVNRQYVHDPLKDADILHVHDLVSVTSITSDDDDDGSFVDETAWAVTDWDLLPLNAALGPEVEPFTEILATSWGTKRSWPVGVRIQVNGVFGWDAVPLAIRDATIELTGILRIESPRATRNIPEMGAAVEQSKVSQDIIARLIRRYRKAGTYFV